MANLRRAGEPPPAGEYIPVWRLKGKSPLTAIVLSPAVWAYWTHWVNGRTLPCTSKDHENCNCPLNGEPQRWKGYLYVQELSGKLGFVELTPAQARQMESQVNPGETYRGMCFKFFRSSDGKGSRAYALREKHVSRDPDTLRPDKDPAKLLLKLWNAPKRYCA